MFLSVACTSVVIPFPSWTDRLRSLLDSGIKLDGAVRVPYACQHKALRSRIGIAVHEFYSALDTCRTDCANRHFLPSEGLSPQRLLRSHRSFHFGT